MKKYAVALSLFSLIAGLMIFSGCGRQQAVDTDLPLHELAFEGNVSAMQRQIAKGADVNAMSEFGNTPLHLAAEAGHIEVVKLLIENGADVNLRNMETLTPLSFGEKHPEIAGLLRQHGAVK